MPNQAVFLDRDGVINFNLPNYIKSIDEVRFIPGSLEAISRLSRTDYLIFIVTNQSLVGRRLISKELALDIHQFIVKNINDAGGRIDRSYICMHSPYDNCECRKPKIAHFLAAKKEFDLIPSKCYMIGDMQSDVEFANNAGIKPIHIGSSVNNLEQAINNILGSQL